MKLSSNPENLRIVYGLEQFIAENSIDSRVTTYAALNKVAGVDVQRKRRYLLDKAIERAEKRCNCVFTCIYNIGIKRLPADDTPQVGARSITGARRKISRALKRIVRVNSNDMSEMARNNTVLKVSHLQVVHGLLDNRRTASFVAPATADPMAAKKATEGMR